MSKRVGPSEQGRLQGSLASLSAVAGIVGPGLFTQIFAVVIAKNTPLYVPGAPFLVASLLLLVALAVATIVTRGNQSARST